MLPLIDSEPFSEKYLNKLIGRTDLEDSLKRLDRLTQEESQMAAAQVLKVANIVDDRVQGIADNVISVDNRLGDVGDKLNEQVTGVDERVKDVNDLVKDVDDGVKAVDEKLAAVIDGAQYIFNQSSKIV